MHDACVNIFMGGMQQWLMSFLPLCVNDVIVRLLQEQSSRSLLRWAYPAQVNSECGRSLAYGLRMMLVG